jgi:sialic acid synthase SpsE
MSESIKINGRVVSPAHATYVVAEVSANNNQDFELAVRIAEAVKHAGADAVKLQTKRPTQAGRAVYPAHTDFESTDVTVFAFYRRLLSTQPQRIWS